jgi:hypothetical protein
VGALLGCRLEIAAEVAGAVCTNHCVRREKGSYAPHAVRQGGAATQGTTSSHGAGLGRRRIPVRVSPWSNRSSD